MRHLRYIINFGYHVTAKERLRWHKKVLKVKILQSGHAKCVQLCSKSDTRKTRHSLQIKFYTLSAIC